MGWRGIVKGVIFDSNFLPTPYDICSMYMSSDYSVSCTREYTSMASGIEILEKIMKRFRDILGDETKMGLSVYHNLQCITVRYKTTREFLSKVDLIL